MLKEFFTGMFVVILREFFDDPQTYIAIGFIALAVILAVSVGLYFAASFLPWYGFVLLLAGISLITGLIVADV